jgi:ketosteroid isomerase-like protein
MLRNSLLAVSCVVVGVSGMSVAAQRAGDIEKNKALAHRYHLEVIQGKNVALADQLFEPDAVFHTPVSKPNDTKGPVKAKEIAEGDFKLCPKGITFVHEPTIAEGDTVAFYWKSKCTKDTGEVSEGAGMDIVKIANGKIAEIWIEWHSIKPDGTGR